MTAPVSSSLAAYRRAFQAWRGDGFSQRSFGAIHLGCESRTVSADYRWDGMRRGADPRHPRIVFQATLSGEGAFDRDGQSWRVCSEKAFFAVLPSRHLYYLPEDSANWSFFWFTFDHPYIVQRLAQFVKRHPPVFALPQGSALAAGCLTFFEQVCRGQFEDEFAEEGALFDWMVNLERHLHDLAHPRGLRDGMLNEVRQFTRENMQRSFGIEEIARRHNLTRSHFSHRFRAATGLAPGAYVIGLRLAEVQRQLRQTHLPLKEIATATGFADANHLCKAFRRQFHMSPGAYRRQVR